MSLFFAFNSAWCIKCDFQVGVTVSEIKLGLCVLTDSLEECQRCQGHFRDNLEVEMELEPRVPESGLSPPRQLPFHPVSCRKCNPIKV